MVSEMRSSWSRYSTRMGGSGEASEEASGASLSSRGAGLGKHEAGQSGCLHFGLTAIVTDRLDRHSLSLSVGLSRGSNRACLGSVYLIQLSIYPRRYLLCSALKPVKACACSRGEGGMTGAGVRVHWKGKHSQPAHVKARRCILPKNEETDWNFTSTLDVAPNCLATTKSTDPVRLKQSILCGLTLLQDPIWLVFSSISYRVILETKLIKMQNEKEIHCTQCGVMWREYVRVQAFTL